MRTRGTLTNSKMATRILAVDDEENIRRLVKISLERVGYEVITASNGREALELVQTQAPDLILMDIMLPELDGLEVLHILKHDDTTSSIPVVLLTAKEQTADVFEGWKNGADLYLTKPFELRELLVFVKHLLETSRHPQGIGKTYEVTVST